MIFNNTGHFIKTRPEQWECAEKIFQHHSNGKRIVRLNAPVKSGKKDIEIGYSFLSSSPGQGTRKRKLFHVCALDRKDTHEQFEELKRHGFEDAIIISKCDRVKKFIKELQLQSLKHDITVMFDECDFGSHERQNMNAIWKECERLKTDVVLISATNFETEFSTKPEIKNSPLVSFTPHRDYRGAEWFLSNNLVHEATTFFNEDEESTILLSSQAEECLGLLNDSEKTFGVVRVASSGAESVTFKDIKKNKQAIEALIAAKFPKIQSIHLIDAAEKFVWGQTLPNLWGGYVNARQKVILIVNQTCTRSTEVGFHEHIAFWHDFRGAETPLSTLIQALGRVFHYEKHDGKNRNIQVYGDPEVFEVAAGSKKAEDAEREIAGRVKTNFGSFYFQNVKLIRFTGHLDSKNREVKDKNKLLSDTFDYCKKRNITLSSSVPHEIKWAVRISRENKYNQAENILKNLRGQRSFSKGFPYYVIDGPSKNWSESFKKLLDTDPSESPVPGKYAIGDVVVVVPIAPATNQTITTPKTQNSMVG